jgi:hypothetical protein
MTLSLFGTVLIASVLNAIPRQAYRALGAELVVLAAIAGAGLHILGLRAEGVRSNQAIARVLEAVTPTTVTSLPRHMPHNPATANCRVQLVTKIVMPLTCWPSYSCDRADRSSALVSQRGGHRVAVCPGRRPRFRGLVTALAGRLTTFDVVGAENLCHLAECSADR